MPDMHNDRDSDRIIPQYSVSVWEVIGITMGAIALVAAGTIGLGWRLLTTMFEPNRAEAIARSLIDYQIPGGSEGVAGMNIGAEKFAIVKSHSQPPDIVLFVSKTPLNKGVEEVQSSLGDEISLQENINGRFLSISSRAEKKVFCGKPVSVTIQKGQQILGDQSSPVPATQYILETSQGGIEYVVNVLTIAPGDEQKAATVFNSLQCKF